MINRQARSINTIRSWATSVLCIGVLLAPLTVLYCEQGDPSAMACCRDRMSECNRPGAKEDCCKKTIGVDAKLAALPNIERTTRWSLAPVDDVIAEIPTVPAMLQHSGAVLDFSLGSPPGPSPPQTSILRI